MASTDWTGERAVAGVTSGLIGADEEVTWKGRHFGVLIGPARATSRITAHDRPRHFQDCMVRAVAFRSFCHDHFFEVRDGATLMKDVMVFRRRSECWEWLLERLVLKRHMLGLLTRRNQQYSASR